MFKIFGKGASKTQAPSAPAAATPTAKTPSQALELYEELKRKGSDIPAALLTQVGDLHRDLGNLEQAVARYTDAVERYIKDETWTPALQVLRKAEHVQDSRTAPLRLLALQIALGQNEYHDARQTIEELSRLLTPSDGVLIERMIEIVDRELGADATVEVSLSEALAALGRPDRALERLKIALGRAQRAGQQSLVEDLTERIRQAEPTVQKPNLQSPELRWPMKPGPLAEPPVPPATDITPASPTPSAPLPAPAELQADPTNATSLPSLPDESMVTDPAASAPPAAPASTSDTAPLPDLMLPPLELPSPPLVSAPLPPVPSADAVAPPAAVPATRFPDAAQPPLADDHLDVPALPPLPELPEAPVAPVAPPPPDPSPAPAPANLAPLTPPSAFPPAAVPAPQPSTAPAPSTHGTPSPLLPATPLSLADDEDDVPDPALVAPPVEQPDGLDPDDPVPAIVEAKDLVRLAATQPDRNATRFVGTDGRDTVTSEAEQVDHLVQQLMQGIRATVPAEEAETHYELAIGFLHMGLFDEAIAEFQFAFRSPAHRDRATEGLAQAFLGKGLPVLALRAIRATLDDRANVRDAEILGLLYWQGRAAEAMGRRQEARELYERVAVQDVTFADAAERLVTLAEG